MFRRDNTNVGDWWCPPSRYFPFKAAREGDILDPDFDFSGIDTLILGGGGLGAEFFRPHLNRIRDKNIRNTILWGVGVDTVKDPGNILPPGDYDMYGDYFDSFDEVGIRVYSEEQRYRYVPCASCMNNLFFKYRDIKPKKLIGFYNHIRVPLVPQDSNNKLSVDDNSGNNLESKLDFLSSHEYIITNTYHGVYWATLLERKVVVIPFKSGLLYFKHQPAFCWDGKITDDVLHSARTYDGALEESRLLNLDFYKDLTDRYAIV